MAATQATHREIVACVNFSPTPMYGYVEGFVQGADALYKALQADRAPKTCSSTHSCSTSDTP